MRVTIIVALLLAAIGCGAATDIPDITTPKTIQTEGMTPTATPPATATPYPTYTPYPTPDIEAIVAKRVEAIIAMTPIPVPTPEPTATPEPTPTIAPTATPEPQIRPVTVPDGTVHGNILKIASISISERRLRLSGIIEGQGHKPTTIQVWQAYNPEPYSETCSTERPVSFIQPGNGSIVYSGQTTPYQWTFCTQYQKGSPQIDDVPWLYSQHWSYELRDRRRTTDPYIYDFRVTASLDHERVERLEYSSGVASGWRVIIWSGGKMIANQWLDY